MAIGAEGLYANNNGRISTPQHIQIVNLSQGNRTAPDSQIGRSSTRSIVHVCRQYQTKHHQTFNVRDASLCPIWAFTDVSRRISSRVWDDRNLEAHVLDKNRNYSESNIIRTVRLVTDTVTRHK